MIIVLGIFKSSLFPTKKNVLKSPLFGSSSLKHTRWRSRTCVSCRIVAKRYVQNRLWDRARRCTTNGIIALFENLHHLLPSIFVFVFLSRVSHRLRLSFAWYSGFSCVFHRCDRLSPPITCRTSDFIWTFFSQIEKQRKYKICQFILIFIPIVFGIFMSFLFSTTAKCFYNFPYSVHHL